MTALIYQDLRTSAFNWGENNFFSLWTRMSENVSDRGFSGYFQACTCSRRALNMLCLPAVLNLSKFFAEQLYVV